MYDVRICRSYTYIASTSQLQNLRREGRKNSFDGTFFNCVMKGSQKTSQALKVEYFMKSKETLLLKFLRLIKATKGLTVSSEY